MTGDIGLTLAAFADGEARLAGRQVPDVVIFTRCWQPQACAGRCTGGARRWFALRLCGGRARVPVLRHGASLLRRDASKRGPRRHRSLAWRQRRMRCAHPAQALRPGTGAPAMVTRSRPLRARLAGTGAFADYPMSARWLE